jgi:hypothetical protein
MANGELFVFYLKKYFTCAISQYFGQDLGDYVGNDAIVTRVADKFEVKRRGALEHRNDRMVVPSCGYSTSNFAGSAYPYNADGFDHGAGHRGKIIIEHTQDAMYQV